MKFKQSYSVINAIFCKYWSWKRWSDQIGWLVIKSSLSYQQTRQCTVTIKTVQIVKTNCLKCILNWLKLIFEPRQVWFWRKFCFHTDTLYQHIQNSFQFQFYSIIWKVEKVLIFQLKTETPADIIQARWNGKYIGAAWNWLQMEKTELQNLYTE